MNRLSSKFDVVTFGVFITVNGRSFIPISPQFASMAQASEFLVEVSKYIPSAYMMRWHTFFQKADDLSRQQMLQEILYPSQGYVLATRIEQALSIRAAAEILLKPSCGQDLKKKPDYVH